MASPARYEDAASNETVLKLHLYAVTAWVGDPRNCQPEENDEVAWFSISDACRLELAHPEYPALFRLFQ